MTEPLNDLDVVALSDRAWEIVDPAGTHEAEEETWSALVPAGWPALATVEELRARLDEVVQTLAPPAPAVPLRAVAAVMTFLAAHPDRHGSDDALLSEALREAFPLGDELPGDVAAWLSERRLGSQPGWRRHGARQPRRYARGRDQTVI